jgi:hypothetical protein
MTLMLRSRLFLTALFCATGLIASATAQDSPATAPAPTSLPTQGGWFAGNASGGAAVDPFARLYPRLAAADPMLRATTPRMLFDTMGSSNKPPIPTLQRMLLTGNVFTEASRRAYEGSRPRDPWLLVPDERKARITAVEAKQAGGIPICFDIEDFPLDARHSPSADIDRSVREIAKVVHWARAQDPAVRIFLYAYLPHTNAHEADAEYTLATTQPTGASYAWWQNAKDDIQSSLARWRDANERLRNGPSRPVSLAELFDGVCPSLYIFPEIKKPDPIRGIKTYVWMHLEEARKYGKPIYPFIWPRFYETDEPVDLTLWVNLVREIMIHGDGAILWDGYRQPWSGPIAMRVRAAQLLAQARGELTDRQLYDLLVKDYPRDPDLVVLRGE